MSDARAAIHAMFQLDEIAEHELDTRLDALIVEALIKAGVQYVDCPACGAAQAVGRPCDTCAFKARMAAELAARGMVAAPAETAAPDFFQPGRTYAHGDYRFICEYLVTHPTSGRRSAWGWFGKNGGWRHHSFSERQFQVREWTDVTEAGDRRG